ncbi:nucleotide exchange factor GrpE [Cyanobacterium sp. Dongsha4]|uniref:nucleotide exchange factor GrpE n=1 Tax=Cyanobacterium sp. DS4 TaxID=2878255 RepID=UPI002E8203AE|nr:nucleotide exchange factor GrpE [Cyanobacterium sp. Dongsha4]WVL02365.1 nucleotide exchange factor GrpE [Cyanobacterium sp. Dongsha4]
MMSEADNYPELEKKTDIADHETNSSPSEEINNQESEVMETDFEQQPVSETVVNNEENAEPSNAEATEPQNDNNQLNSVVESLQKEIESLKQELELKEEQVKSANSQFMRLTADFDNFRRRTSREKEELESQVKKKIINEILPAVDNFERARNQIKPANDGEMTIHKSYQGVYKILVEGLKKVGVSAMRPENQPFDPNFHEAMLREPTNEYPEGTVIEQLVRGYMIDDQVLRYAMVKVAMPGENESENTDLESETSENSQE